MINNCTLEDELDHISDSLNYASHFLDDTMATTPEGKVKDSIRELLRAHDVYWFCPVQNGLGAPSLDFLCCFNGKFVGIEAKAPGKKPTPRQLNTMDEMFKAGADIFVIDGIETLKVLNEYLNGNPDPARNLYLTQWMQSK